MENWVKKRIEMGVMSISMCVCVSIRVCVYMCVRERERDSQTEMASKTSALDMLSFRCL